MKNIPLIIDLSFCLFFLPLMLVLMPKEAWMWEKYPMFFYFLVGWLYIIYISNRCVTVPMIFRGGWRSAGGVAITVLLMFVTWLFTRIDMFSPLYEGQTPYSEQYPWRIVKLELYRQAVWLFFIIVEAFSFAVGLLIAFMHQKEKRAAAENGIREIENERDKAELALYKAQINPHFLFNTLNSLYGLLITHSEKTELAMEQFIKVTKYMHGSSSRNYISIDEEIEYIGAYIDLQKLRLNSFAEVTFTHDVQRQDASVPPMLLITFVENAFKYGISSDEPCFIRIRLEVGMGGDVRFVVENSVFGRHNSSSGGMGLENCRKRLSLLYPGRHSLEAGEVGSNMYRVRLLLNSGICGDGSGDGDGMQYVQQAGAGPGQRMYR